MAEPLSPKRRKVDTASADDRFLRAIGRRFAGGDLDEREWTGPWMFVQMADTQLGMYNLGSPNYNWDIELSMLEIAVQRINLLRPKFVIVCGDLINEYPETAEFRRVGKTADAAIAERQVADFKRIMSCVDAAIPLVCLCGNHDVGDLVDRAAIEVYRRRFGDDYLEFWAGGSQCVVINSSLLSAKEVSRQGDKAEALALAAEQDVWLEKVLPDKASDETSSATLVDGWMPPLLVFSHIPPFIYAPDEPKGYFNLEPEIRRPVLNRLKRAGACKWFCGHFHRNAGGWDAGLEVVVTSAAGTVLGSKKGADKIQLLGLEAMDFAGRECSPSASGIRCVCVTRSHGVRHRWFTLESVPASIDPSNDCTSWEGAPLLGGIGGADDGTDAHTSVSDISAAAQSRVQAAY